MKSRVIYISLIIFLLSCSLKENTKKDMISNKIANNYKLEPFLFVLQKANMEGMKIFLKGFVLKNGENYISNPGFVRNAEIITPDSTIDINTTQKTDIMQKVFNGYSYLGPNIMWYQLDLVDPSPGNHHFNIKLSNGIQLKKVLKFTEKQNIIKGFPENIKFNPGTGIISWNKSKGAKGYRVKIYKGNKDDSEKLVYVSNKHIITNPYFNISNEFQFKKEQYTISIECFNEKEFLKSNYVHRSLNFSYVHNNAINNKKNNDVEWITSSPALQKVSEKELHFIDQYIKKDLKQIQSIILIKNGKMIFEKYYNYATKDMLFNVRSVTKSFISTLVGIAIEKGYIKSVHDKINIYLKDIYKNIKNPQKKKISIYHLLNMTAGLKWVLDWENPKGFAWNWFRIKNKVPYTLNFPLLAKPGKKCIYSSALSHIISAVITHATKMDTKTFADQYLFGPLKITNYSWDKLDQYYGGGFGLSLRPRDMAKFGQLFLNDGQWNGKQIISRKWIKYSTKKHALATIKNKKLPYGLHWWPAKIKNFKCYKAVGAGGQFIMVIPSLKLVTVITTRRFKIGVSDLFKDLLTKIIHANKNRALSFNKN